MNRHRAAEPTQPPATAFAEALRAMPATKSRWQRFSLRAVLPEWTPLYLGFLLFELAIITYRFPVGRVGVVLGVLALAFTRDKVRFPTPLLALGAMVLLAAFGLPGSVDHALTQKELFEVAKTWVIGLIAYNAIRTPKQFRFAMLFALAAYAFVPVRPVLVNYALGITTAGRAEGPFIYINPNDLAAITLLALGATLWVLTTEPMQKTLRLIGFGFAGTLVVMMLLTQSRGGFVGLVMLGLPYAFSSARRGAKPLALILAATVAAAVIVPTSAWERLAGMKKLTSRQTLAEADVEGSAEQRYAIAKTTVDIILDHPATGVGLAAVGTAYRPYRRGIADRDTHNTYLKVAAEIGLPGLILFLFMIVTVWRTISRARRAVRATEPAVAAGFGYLQYGLFGFLVAGLFGSYAWLSIFHLFLAIMWSGATIWLASATATATTKSPVPVATGRPQPAAVRRRVPLVPRRGR